MIDASHGLTSLAPYVQAGGTIGILSVLLGFWLKKRKDDRDGWGALITALQSDVRSVRNQHADCERRLTEVEAQLRGVHRQLVTQSSIHAVGLSSPSEMVVEAAKRAADHVAEK